MAGGRGSRLENKDKGLVHLQNKTLVEHVIKRIAPQVNQLSISCNRNQEQYQTILDQNLNGFHDSSKNQCLTDNDDQFAGPLAGIARFLPDSTHDYLFICPCDTPLLPSDLVMRLLGHLQETGAQACFPCDTNQKHPLILLIKRDIAQLSMTRLLSNSPLSSTRSPSVRDWLAHLDSSELFCDDESLTWSNINNRNELEKISLLLRQKSA